MDGAERTSDRNIIKLTSATPIIPSMLQYSPSQAKADWAAPGAGISLPGMS